MAQWLGQFTGHTHATKVADREKILCEAISRCLAANTDVDAPPHLPSLAQRVIDARLKFMRAQLSELREPRSGAMPLQQIERMEHRIRELESGGVPAILREFHCPQHVIDTISPPSQP